MPGPFEEKGIVRRMNGFRMSLAVSRLQPDSLKGLRGLRQP